MLWLLKYITTLQFLRKFPGMGKFHWDSLSSSSFIRRENGMPGSKLAAAGTSGHGLNLRWVIRVSNLDVRVAGLSRRRVPQIPSVSACSWHASNLIPRKGRVKFYEARFHRIGFAFVPRREFRRFCLPRIHNWSRDVRPQPAPSRMFLWSYNFVTYIRLLVIFGSCRDQSAFGGV